MVHQPHTAIVDGLLHSVYTLLMPWVNFHDFAPISPKLTTVLRSFILPIEEEDTDSEIRELRQCWYNAAVHLVFGSLDMTARCFCLARH